MCHHLFGEIRAIMIEWTNTLWLCRQQKHTVFSFEFFCFAFLRLLFSLDVYGYWRSMRTHTNKCMCDERNSRYESVNIALSHILSLCLPFVCSVCVCFDSLCISLLNILRTHLLMESIIFFSLQKWQKNVRIFADGVLNGIKCRQREDTKFQMKISVIRNRQFHFWMSRSRSRYDA